MSGFVNLHAEVMAMFAGLDGVGRMHEQLELWAWARRRQAEENREQNKRWRKANPRRYAELRKPHDRNYRKRHRAAENAKKQRWRDKYPDKARAQWRRSTAAYRARKKAAA